MCDNLKPIEAKRVKGYKVVMEKDGERYSAAMGTKYRSGRLVTVPKMQAKLTDKFHSYILDQEVMAGFEEKMVGRTSAFKLVKDANHLALAIINTGTTEGYTVSVYSVGLSNGLMEGNYGRDRSVYAGRRMTFISKESA